MLGVHEHRQSKWSQEQKGRRQYGLLESAIVFFRSLNVCHTKAETAGEAATGAALNVVAVHLGEGWRMETAVRWHRGPSGK